MKVTNKELDLLIGHFKLLARLDVVGITVTDARNTVRDWLAEVSGENEAVYFANKVYKYQAGPEIAKAERDYNG